MEDNKNRSTLKTVLLVFGILFSIVFVPGLIVGIPVGGTAIALSSAVSQENVLRTAEEAKLSEKLHDMVLEVVLEEAKVEELNPEFWNGLIEGIVSVDVLDTMITEVVVSAYNGTEPKMDLHGALDGVKRGLDEVAENGFSDIYSAWTEDTPSKYFSAEFVQSLKESVENQVLDDYAQYGAVSLDELEELYDTQYGDGAFSKLMDEQMSSFEEQFDEEFTQSIGGEFDGLTEELEQEINQGIYEAVQSPDVREVFDVLKVISDKSGLIKSVVYAIIACAVLLLLVCYMFGTAGFVVSAIPLLLGGAICKVLMKLESVVLDYVRELLLSEPDLAQVGDMAMDIAGGILDPIFTEISKFGTMTIGAGALLVLLAILRGVLKKNARAAE